MRRILVITAFASLLPLSVFTGTALASMGGGYGGGGGGGYGMGNAGGSLSNEGREEAQAAIKLIEKEQYADAIPHLKRALMMLQGNADILNLLGFTERMVGDYPTSLDYYQRALARNPNHIGAHEYLGELYLLMHQPDQARGQLAELVRLCPDGCMEESTLKQSIANYMAANPAGAPAPASPQSPAAAPPASSQQQTPSQSAPATGAPAQQPAQSSQPPNP